MFGYPNWRIDALESVLQYLTKKSFGTTDDSIHLQSNHLEGFQ